METREERMDHHDQSFGHLFYGGVGCDHTRHSTPGELLLYDISLVPF